MEMVIDVHAHVRNVIVTRTDTGEVYETYVFIGTDMDKVRTSANDFFLEKVRKYASFHARKAPDFEERCLEEEFFCEAPWCVTLDDPVTVSAY